MAVKLTCGNFYKGLGKTSTLAIFALLLQNKKQKTLMIDFDPTANLTRIFEKKFTRDLQDHHLSVFESLQLEDLSVGIVSLNYYLDIIPSSNDFLNLPPILFGRKPEDFLAILLQSIESNYDFILLDLPSVQNIYTNHVYNACDYILPIVEPARISGQAFSNIVDEIVMIVKKKNKKLEILGVIESTFKLEAYGKGIGTLRICDERIQKMLFSEMIHNGELIHSWLSSGRSWGDMEKLRYLDTFSILLEEIQNRLKK